MPLTVAQTTAFFEHDVQMGIPHDTVIQLQAEGITLIDDLVDFDKDTLEQVAANLRRPAGRVPDPNPNAAPGATIPTPSFVFGAKSQKRLVTATQLLRYYEEVGRTTTPGNIQWTPVMKNFAAQWNALEDKKKADEPDIPKITKALPVIKWTEAFRDYLHRMIGVRTIPLAYVIRPDDVVPPIGIIAGGTPHSQEHGSIEDELIARASHTNPLYREDNSAVYYKLEEATRATSYAASIKPYQRTKNGRGAWLALSNQYAGRDKWEAEINRHEQLLHTRIWKGQSNFPLERFIAQHRNAYVSMQAASDHVTYQLPNEHSRVGYLLTAIQCSDAGLQAAMASIKTDQAPNGLRNDFEAAASHLLPYDPVQKKRTERPGNKRDSANISDTTGEEAEVSAFGAKKGTGKTGVHLRYHNADEYKKLSKHQKDELREWRITTGQGKGKSENDSKKKPRVAFDRDKAIASAVTKQVAEKMKAVEQAKTNGDEAEAYIMSIFKKMSAKATVSDVSAERPAAVPSSLKGIMKRAKNHKTEN
jgi:hypothetical protein